MLIVFSKKCVDYSWPGHIESPKRVETALHFLETKYEVIEPEPALEDDLLSVHSREYIDLIKRTKPGNYFDGDTPAPKNIYDYALLSAGGALLAAQKNGFSLMRPPGHHAGINGRALGVSTLGFCYFNNIAIAVKKMNEQTLILDIDGHHGNGTQEIFQGDQKVTFISLHRYPTYPGTGLRSQDNCLNFPLPYSTGDKLYLETLDSALKQIEIDNIERIAVSAGFDAHEGDLASLNLTSKCYGEIGRKIGALDKPIFIVLEGGYIGKNVGMDIHELISGIEETQ